MEPPARFVPVKRFSSESASTPRPDQSSQRIMKFHEVAAEMCLSPTLRRFMLF